MVEFSVKIKKVHLAVFVSLALVVLAGAYGDFSTGDPAVVGHSSDELMVKVPDSTSGTEKTLQAAIDAGDLSAWTRSGADIHYGGGNVGIGTMTPTGLLEVAGSLGSWSFDPTGASVLANRNSANYIIASQPGGSLVFKTGGTADTNNRLRITPGGRVGISDFDGLFTPGSTLHVKGDVLVDNAPLTVTRTIGGLDAALNVRQNGGGLIAEFGSDANNNVVDIGFNGIVLDRNGVVNTYIQFDRFDGTPPASHCNENSEIGRMAVDSVLPLLYLCGADSFGSQHWYGIFMDASL